MRRFAGVVSLAAVLMPPTGMAGAAEIRVLGVSAVQEAVRSIAEEFRKETGHQVIFTIEPPEVVAQKIEANEIHDAVIVSEPAMDRLDTDGLVNPESRVRLASSGSSQAAGDGAPAATTYEGAVMSEGSAPQAARAFILFLASAEARAAWLAARLEPLSDH